MAGYKKTPRVSYNTSLGNVQWSIITRKALETLFVGYMSGLNNTTGHQKCDVWGIALDILINQVISIRFFGQYQWVFLIPRVAQILFLGSGFWV